MIISLIAAMDNNRVIGINNQLPWHLPADLSHFKAKTLKKPILMGRLTHESIGKPLPHRQNIILTRQKNFQASGCTIINSIDEISSLELTDNELMVIGGTSIYQAMLARADIMYLTLVDTEVKGDAYFPNWRSDEWITQEKTYRQADAKNPYDLRFITLGRKT